MGVAPSTWQVVFLPQEIHLFVSQRVEIGQRNCATPGATSWMMRFCVFFFSDHVVQMWCVTWDMPALRQILPLQAISYHQSLGGGFKYFYFHPYLRKIPILTNIFQMGWNHQPDHCFGGMPMLPRGRVHDNLATLVLGCCVFWNPRPFRHPLNDLCVNVAWQSDVTPWFLANRSVRPVWPSIQWSYQRTSSGSNIPQIFEVLL